MIVTPAGHSYPIIGPAWPAVSTDNATLHLPIFSRQDSCSTRDKGVAIENKSDRTVTDGGFVWSLQRWPSKLDED
jgi:hypothetical protein